MEIYDLKIDKKLPHHYLIGVYIEPMTSGDEGGLMKLKYGPLYFNNDDVERLRDALILCQDKLFPTSTREALDIQNVRGLVQAINAMKIACKVNLATMHHFSSATEMTDDDFLTIVEVANKTNEGRKLLNDSRMG